MTVDQSLVRELDRLSAGSSRSEIVEKALAGWSIMKWTRRIGLSRFELLASRIETESSSEERR